MLFLSVKVKQLRVDTNVITELLVTHTLYSNRKTLSVTITDSLVYLGTLVLTEIQFKRFSAVNEAWCKAKESKMHWYSSYQCIHLLNSLNQRPWHNYRISGRFNAIVVILKGQFHADMIKISAMK